MCIWLTDAGRAGNANGRPPFTTDDGVTAARPQSSSRCPLNFRDNNNSPIIVLIIITPHPTNSGENLYSFNLLGIGYMSFIFEYTSLRIIVYTKIWVDAFRKRNHNLIRCARDHSATESITAPLLKRHTGSNPADEHIWFINTLDHVDVIYTVKNTSKQGVNTNVSSTK